MIKIELVPTMLVGRPSILALNLIRLLDHPSLLIVHGFFATHRAINLRVGMLKRKLNDGLGYIILFSLLSLSCGIGAYAAYIAMISSLIGFAFAFDLDAIKFALKQVWVQMFLLAYALIAISFLVTAKDLRDVLSIFDFFPLLLVVPAAMIFKNMNWRHPALIVSWFAYFGVCLSLIVAVYGIATLENDARPQGIEMGTVHLAYFSLILGFLSVAILFDDGQKKNWILLTGPLFGISTAVATGTRSSFIVLACLSVVAAIFFIQHFRDNMKRTLMAFAAAVICLFFIVGGAQLIGQTRSFATIPNIIEALRGDSLVDISSSQRIEHFVGGWHAFIERPILGHGWYHQVEAALPYMTNFGSSQFSSASWAYLHNEALSLLVSCGILGLIAYILIFMAGIVGTVRQKQYGRSTAKNYCLAVVTVGIFAGGMTEVLFKYELPKAFLIFMTAILLLNFNRKEIQ